MEFTIRLAQIVEERLGIRRGAIKEICDYTNLERHAVADIYHNRAKYVSLKTLGGICDFLIQKARMDPADLPGALFEENHGFFLDMLAERDTIDVYVGARQDLKRRDLRWVVLADTDLQSQLLHGISNIGDAARRHGVSFASPHRVMSPREGRQKEMQTEAEAAYATFDGTPGRCALVSLGSIKSNALSGMVLARAFALDPWKSVDKEDACRCPIYLRYRDDDPKPESCCSGMRHPSGTGKGEPGIYFETPSGSWSHLPCNENEDAAIVFYTMRPTLGRMEVSLGGFSAIGTDQLSRVLLGSQSEFAPCYEDNELQVGAVLFSFKMKRSANKPVVRAHRLAQTVLKRHLGRV